jgi:hypothetical protein
MLSVSTSPYDEAYVFGDEDADDETLIRDFDRDGVQGAEELLGFDQDGLEDDTEEQKWDLADDGPSK